MKLFSRSLYAVAALVCGVVLAAALVAVGSVLLALAAAVCIGYGAARALAA